MPQETKILKHASVFISLILAGLYALGITLHQGFLSNLGLEETQFPLSVDRTFFQGFMAATQMGAKGFLYLIGSAGAVLISAEIGVFVSSWINNTDIQKRLNEIFGNNSTSQEVNSFTEFSLKALSYSILAFVMYALMLFALSFSYKSGVELSNKFKKNALKNEYIEKTIKFHKDPNVIKGYSIICNDKQCAYLVNGNALVLNNRDIQWVKSE